LKKFDPYEILEVSPNADASEIKKAYKKMSRMYHPDVNKDDPEATAKFMLILKANECLSDETKRKLCEKYGNPDGKGRMQVAIAMPSFLLDKQYKFKALLVFVVVFFLVLPYYGYKLYSGYNRLD